MSQHHVHRVHGVGADGLVQLQGLRHAAASQHLVEHVPADQRHELDGNFKRAIFPSLAWQRDVQVHLRRGAERKSKDKAGQKKVSSQKTVFTQGRFVCVEEKCLCVFFLCHVSVMFSSSPLWVPQAVGWLCTGSSFHRRLACDPQRLSP